MASRGTARASLEETRLLLDQVRAARVTVEALKPSLSPKAADDSRYLDNIRSLRQLEAQLLATLKRLDAAAI